MLQAERDGGKWLLLPRLGIGDVQARSVGVVVVEMEVVVGFCVPRCGGQARS